VLVRGEARDVDTRADRVEARGDRGGVGAVRVARSPSANTADAWNEASNAV
jgi:hypothetical protein